LGHPEIDNRSPFAFEPLFIADEELRPVVVTLVKATFRFDLAGSVTLADEQVPVNLAGEPWTSAPISSYKHEPEVALCKPATDVILVGHAQPPTAGATQVDVGIKVGPVQKVARVFGDRFWVWNGRAATLSRTAPLVPMPLMWEKAFGGRDSRNSTPQRELFEPRNPVGTGFGRPLAKEGDHLKLPNIEDPQQLLGGYGDVVPPCGFGFVSPSWQPRAAFAGTYDDAWNKSRKPLLPVDFDRRFFNAAPSGLIAGGYLRGDEDVTLLNVTAAPRVSFRLPAVPPPVCRVVVRNEPDTTVATNLDTIIVNADDGTVTMLWRAYVPVADGPHSVITFEVAATEP
jgi:hypothetical protein